VRGVAELARGPGPGRGPGTCAGSARLTTLPLLAQALAHGELSYAKVRALTRVATPETEERLLAVGRAGTACHVERIVRAWRRVDRIAETREAAGATRAARFAWGVSRRRRHAGRPRTPSAGGRRRVGGPGKRSRWPGSRRWGRRRGAPRVAGSPSRRRSSCPIPAWPIWNAKWASRLWSSIFSEKPCDASRRHPGRAAAEA
jgi:hypothetical protein